MTAGQTSTMQQRQPPPIPQGHPGFTEEWLHWAIGFVSEIIVLHGPRYAPLLDRLERELAEMQRTRGEDPVSRAKRHLARLQNGEMSGTHGVEP